MNCQSQTLDRSSFVKTQKRVEDKKMRVAGWRRRRLSVLHWLLIGSSAIGTALGLLIVILRSAAIDSTAPTLGLHLHHHHHHHTIQVTEKQDDDRHVAVKRKGCATVEEMGDIFRRGFAQESLGARHIIHRHFALNGASTVRALPPEQFCRHGFVIGKASEAGFGNEMYKILTAAALSVMLNRSLIIGQTRHIEEIKHLWRMNRCVTKYGRNLVMRIDDFQRPSRTEVLCGNWKEWDQPIIWFQNTTDAVGAQFFLKNVHPQMRKAASDLFGMPEDLHHRPNVFGELMRVLISPSESVEQAVRWALGSGGDPDIALHMRMLMNRSVRAVQAALECIRKTKSTLSYRPKVVLVSDTPSLLDDIEPKLAEFSEVVHFDYEHFVGNITGKTTTGVGSLNFRRKDWGPAPRWVAFVDFFLASRAKHAVISGAQRRVGTTYAQLIAALAAAHRLDNSSDGGSGVAYLSSFQSNLLSAGLKNQVGWGHVWNRFAGPLSCSSQPNQCAATPVLPPAWWDGLWQSPIPRDISRMEAYGIRLSALGTVDEDRLHSFCRLKRPPALTVTIM